MPSLDELIDIVRDDAELFGPDAPCPVRHEPGTNPRLLLVTGGNAAGKSLVCRFLDARARDTWDKPVEFIRVGMGRRTAPGMERAFMFGGNEDTESTGRISANAIKGGLSTSRGRGRPHFLCYDEPDVGLSEEMQGGLGAVLAEFGADLPEHLCGLVVVTHSRPLVRALLPLGPRCLRVGVDPRTTAEWATSEPVPATAEAFLALGMDATHRMRAIKAIMDARKAEKSGGPGFR